MKSGLTSHEVYVVEASRSISSTEGLHLIPSGICLPAKRVKTNPQSSRSFVKTIFTAAHVCVLSVFIVFNYCLI